MNNIEIETPEGIKLMVLLMPIDALRILLFAQSLLLFRFLVLDCLFFFHRITIFGCFLVEVGVICFI
jgi:hypothetical protein